MKTVGRSGPFATVGGHVTRAMSARRQQHALDVPVLDVQSPPMASRRLEVPAPPLGVEPAKSLPRPIETRLLQDRCGRLPKNASIAIIGAGTTGLSAARALCDAGYTSVNVLEAEPQVGGKSRSIAIGPGGRRYDVGAVAGVAPAYDGIFGLSRDLGVVDQPLPRMTGYDLKTGRRETSRLGDTLALAWEVVRYAYAQGVHWRDVHGPAWGNIPEALRQPWNDVVRQRGYVQLEKKIRPLVSGCGYGVGDIPAAYVANYINVEMLVSLALHRCRTWREGTQEIWRRESRRLQQEGVVVETGKRVVSIARGAEVQIQVEGEACPRVYDKVLATGDFTTLPIVDLSPEEMALRQKVAHCDYRVFVLHIEGLPDENEVAVGAIAQNQTPGHEGRPMLWVKKYADTDVYVVYTFGAPGLDDATILRRFAQDFNKLSRCRGGVRMRPAVAHGGYRWSYFPHVKTPALGERFFARLEGMQGVGGLLFAGELFSPFSILPRVRANGVHMAQRMAENRFAVLHRQVILWDENLVESCAALR